jgi:hypothetical protein
MKKYKLKKNIYHPDPAFCKQVGTMCSLINNTYLWDDNLRWVINYNITDTLEKENHLNKTIIENNPEWFEKIDEESIFLVDINHEVFKNVPKKLLEKLNEIIEIINAKI